jgi:hypothetical protein
MEASIRRDHRGAVRCERIVVGYDGSPAARTALVWAMRRAGRTGVVSVVSTWSPNPAADLTLLRDRVIAEQRQAIRNARAATPRSSRPVATGTVVMCDLVTALRLLADRADRIVIGAARANTAARALRRALVAHPRPYGGPCPLTIISARYSARTHPEGRRSRSHGSADSDSAVASVTRWAGMGG